MIVGQSGLPGPADGLATITDFDKSYQGALIITNTLGGLRVAEISDYAFRDCAGLAYVTIPAGVTRIGSHAFRDCKALPSVTIPASVSCIGAAAFWGCLNLTNFTIPVGITEIKSWTFIKECIIV